MARTLDVYLHTDLIGRLTQDDGGDLSFQYAEIWLEKPGSAPLSHSLPLRQRRFRQKECRGFFAGILPEESKREMIARNLGISARNDYAMLERIGGECAGAVTFMPQGEPIPDRHHGYRRLSEEELGSPARRIEGTDRRDSRRRVRGVRRVAASDFDTLMEVFVPAVSHAELAPSSPALDPRRRRRSRGIVQPCSAEFA